MVVLPQLSNVAQNSKKNILALNGKKATIRA